MLNKSTSQRVIRPLTGKSPSGSPATPGSEGTGVHRAKLVGCKNAGEATHKSGGDTGHQCRPRGPKK